jgi:hypothetical protein
MAQLFWGVDGRTHRLGPDGLALCRTQLDNARPPEDRAVSGCSVCDILLRDRDIWAHARAPGRMAPGVRPLLPMLLLAFAVAAVIWAITRF